MIYEWDPEKATANLRKHKVSFREASTVFSDPSAITFDDPDHADTEKRFVTIGTSNKGRIVFLAHADRGDDRIRIISARRTTTSEAYAYQEPRKRQR